MKIRLIKAATVKVLAGEIVEVSPDSGRWLVSNGLAEIMPLAEKKTPEKAMTKTTRKK